MKRRFGRISSLLLATSFLLMTFSSAALAGPEKPYDALIKQLELQQDSIKKTLLRPAEKAVPPDEALIASYKQQLAEISQLIKVAKASNKL
jgi:hypothetical protein